MKKDALGLYQKNFTYLIMNIPALRLGRDQCWQITRKTNHEFDAEVGCIFGAADRSNVPDDADLPLAIASNVDHVADLRADHRVPVQDSNNR